MKRWPIVKLASVTSKVGSGATPRGGESVYKRTGIPLIRSMNVHFDGFRRDGLVFIDNQEASKLDHVEVQGGDVLFNITGASIGRVTNAPPEMAGARVNQHVCILRPTTTLLPRFLCYYLRSPDQQALVGSNQVGGTRQAVTKGMLLDWKISLPPIAEQRAIVELLDEADELEKLRTTTDQCTAAFVPALFNEMFGDPLANTKGWQVVNAEEACLRVTDGTHDTPAYITEGVPLITSKNLRGGIIDFSDVQFISRRDHEEIIKRSNAEPGDILFAMIGTIGNAAIVPSAREFSIKNVGLFKPNPSRINTEYLHAFLSYPRFVERLLASAKGVTQKFVGLGMLRSICIPLPPLELQKEFAARVTEMRGLEAQQAASRVGLDRLFQSMLHRAFEGEL
jgi:type I restriction enzyme, S subunit